MSMTVNDLLFEPIAMVVFPVTGNRFSTSR